VSSDEWAGANRNSQGRLCRLFVVPDLSGSWLCQHEPCAVRGSHGDGAGIGADSGHAAGGAIVGGLAGAMTGAVIGDAADAREERDVAMYQRDQAVAQAQYIAQQQQGLTNFDLIRLAQSGVSDDVTINMIQSRGGQFDLSTDAIIALKSNGVSDRVIVAAQTAPNVSIRTNSGTTVTTPPPQPGVVVVQPQPATVRLEPAPPVFWGIGFGHHHHHRHHHWRHGHPRSHVDFHFGF
jgi:hypothetical protein